MLFALRMNSENFGHTAKNKIFRLVKLLADLSTRLYASLARSVIFSGISLAHLSTAVKNRPDEKL